MDTLRVVYRGIHSKTSGDFLSTDYVNWTVLRVTWPPIRSNSIVLISASECRTDDVQRFTPFFERYVGDAPITVRNISPQEGFVDFWIYVDWEHPLNVAVDLVVLDPPNLMVVVEGDLQNQEVFQVDVSPKHKQAKASVKPKRKRKR